MILELHSNCRTPFKWELWHICCLSSLGDIIWPLLSRYPGKTFQKKAFNPFIFDCYAYQLNSNGKGIESPLMFTLLREFGWGVLPQQWTLWELLLLPPAHSFLLDHRLPSCQGAWPVNWGRCRLLLLAQWKDFQKQWYSISVWNESKPYS